jgi:hypothetical protein
MTPPWRRPASCPGAATHDKSVSRYEPGVAMTINVPALTGTETCLPATLRAALESAADWRQGGGGPLSPTGC